jgi:hypothetical protein
MPLKNKGILMAESYHRQANSIFVIHFYRSYQNRGPTWRGRIEHVQSGKWSYFYHPRDMLRFVQGFDILMETTDEGEDDQLPTHNG